VEIACIISDEGSVFFRGETLEELYLKIIANYISHQDWCFDEDETPKERVDNYFDWVRETESIAYDTFKPSSYPVEYLGEIEIPNTRESLDVFRTPGGVLFGVDSSYVEQDIGEVFSPVDYFTEAIIPD
jgi:hypothetical protein